MFASEPKPSVIALLSCLALSAAPYAEAGQATITGSVVAKEDGRVEVRYELPDDAAPLTGDRVEFRLIIRGVPAGAGSGSVVQVDESSLWVSGPDLDPPLGAEALIHATGDAEAARSRRSRGGGSSIETTSSADAERNPVAGMADALRLLTDTTASATGEVPRLILVMRLVKVRRRAEAGDLEAQLELGRRYRKGEGVAVDLEEALHWYRQAAEQGDPYAQFRVGYALRAGEGVPRDSRAGCDWYQRAARNGDAIAMNNLGLCYRDGDGRPRDIAEASRWFREACDAGNERSCDELGQLPSE